MIRHKYDYGAVLLLDTRFNNDGTTINLSKWLRPHVRKDEGFGKCITGLARFFKNARENETLSRVAPPGGVKFSEGGVDHPAVEKRRRDRRVEVSLCCD